MKVVELRDLAKSSGLKGYSKLNKSELIKFLKKHLKPIQKISKASPKQKTLPADVLILDMPLHQAYLASQDSYYYKELLRLNKLISDDMKKTWENFSRVGLLDPATEKWYTEEQYLDRLNLAKRLITRIESSASSVVYIAEIPPVFRAYFSVYQLAHGITRQEGYLSDHFTFINPHPQVSPVDLPYHDHIRKVIDLTRT